MKRVLIATPQIILRKSGNYKTANKKMHEIII